MTDCVFIVHCPRCGQQEVDPADVNLQVCSTDTARSFYAWDCYVCASEIRKIADRDLICKLLNGGVERHLWDIPAEALEEHRGAAFTTDDLLDFMRELRSLIAIDSSAGASDGPSDGRGTT